MRETTIGESLLIQAGLSPEAASQVYAVAGVVTGGASIIANVGSRVLSAGNRMFNGIRLDARLPAPAAGWGYQPTVIDNINPNIANSQVNGFNAELNLANEVAALPNQTVVKYGDVIGRNGSDVISVDTITGEVTLWDSKFRSGSTAIQESPTFTNSTTLNNARREAIEEIRASTLSDSIKSQAIQNIRNGTFNMNTVGAGNATNSVAIRLCNNKICGN